MKVSRRIVGLVLLPLSAACSSPLDQTTEIPPSGGGGAVGAGGFSLPDAPLASGGMALDGGGAGGVGGYRTTSPPVTDPRFDPAILAIDAGSSIDSDDAPSMGIVIFDRSGSMQSGWTTAETDNPDSAVTVSKWVAASRALIGSLTPVQDRVTIGAVMFPSDNNCAVAPLDDSIQFDFMPAREFIAEYVARSPENQPQGNTPLAVAFQVADQAIQDARVQGRLTGRFFVMVLTDGEPNCGSDMSLVVALASSWLTQGIQTYVFGLPGSESAHMVLDSVAEAGGTQTIVVPGSSQQLEDGMAAIY